MVSETNLLNRMILEKNKSDAFMALKKCREEVAYWESRLEILETQERTFETPIFEEVYGG